MSMSRPERIAAHKSAERWATDLVELGAGELSSGNLDEIAALLRSLSKGLAEYAGHLESLGAREERLFHIAESLGFTGAGAGREAAMLQALRWIADHKPTVS